VSSGAGVRHPCPIAPLRIRSLRHRLPGHADEREPVRICPESDAAAGGATPSDSADDGALAGLGRIHHRSWRERSKRIAERGLARRSPCLLVGPPLVECRKRYPLEDHVAGYIDCWNPPRRSVTIQVAGVGWVPRVAGECVS